MRKRIERENRGEKVRERTERDVRWESKRDDRKSYEERERERSERH